MRIPRFITMFRLRKNTFKLDINRGLFGTALMNLGNKSNLIPLVVKKPNYSLLNSMISFKDAMVAHRYGTNQDH